MCILYIRVCTLHLCGINVGRIFTCCEYQVWWLAGRALKFIRDRPHKRHNPAPQPTDPILEPQPSIKYTNTQTHDQGSNTKTQPSTTGTDTQIQNTNKCKQLLVQHQGAAPGRTTYKSTLEIVAKAHLKLWTIGLLFLNSCYRIVLLKMLLHVSSSAKTEQNRGTFSRVTKYVLRGTVWTVRTFALKRN